MSKEEGLKLELDHFEELIQGLIDNKFGCCNDFITPITSAGLRANISVLAETGKLKIAGIGNQGNLQNNLLIRNDRVNWIQNLSTNAFEEVYLQKIWRFIHHLNTTCFTSIQSFESHYSNYKIGAFYKRHIDQFKTEKGRQFSIVLYLNQEWKTEDDGNLSLYPLNAAQTNISPQSGRMVFFKSDEMEHEVHPCSTRERNSIAGWLKN